MLFSLVVALASNAFLYFHPNYFMLGGFNLTPYVLFGVIVSVSYVFIFNKEWVGYKNKVPLFTNSVLVTLSAGLLSMHTFDLVLNGAFRFDINLPLFLEIPAVWLIYDFAGYLFHRMQHSNAFLWRYHSYHHTMKESNWLDAQRIHVFEFMVPYFFASISCYVLGFGMYAESFYKMTAIGVFATFSHSRWWVSKTPLRQFFTTPDFHLQHHKKLRGNYSAFGSIVWDRIFKTHIGYVEGNEKLSFPGPMATPTLKKTLESCSPLGHKSDKKAGNSNG